MPILILILISFCLSGCPAYDFSNRVVQQGNLLPLVKVNRVKIGMHKDDVAILMGNSLLSPMFNEQRWDYTYRWRRGSGPTTVRIVSIYFANDRVVRVEHGDTTTG